jgi:PleD family two-component response regulator
MRRSRTALAAPESPVRSRPCILVIDDETSNFELLADVFGDDYELLFATEGLAALEIAALKLPDIILLDVMMPGIDGFEVCRRLKTEQRTSGISVIFITGSDGVPAETKGLELGAVDYISKPIHCEAVRAREYNQIKLSWARDKSMQLAQLEQVLREKRIEALSHMAGGLAHEIANPLAIIHGRAAELQRLAGAAVPIAPLDAQTACECILRTSD